MSREIMTKAAQLERLLGERILILDGAMGTMIQSYRLAEADYAASALPRSRGISRATTISCR